MPTFLAESETEETEETTPKQSNNAAYVGVGKPKVGGAIFIAPANTNLPSDANSDLNGSFQLLGYVSEDGVTITTESDSENILAWGGDAVYTTQTSFTETVAFTPIEVNPVVARAQYGDENVEITSAKNGEEEENTGGLMVVKHTAAAMPEKVLVIETIPNKDTVLRFVIPRAKLTEKGDQTLNDSEPMGRELTFTCLPDDKGVTMYEYVANASFKDEQTPDTATDTDTEDEGEEVDELSTVGTAEVGEGIAA